jgi:hypothetical protein
LDNSNNISFNDLQHYEINPPAFLFEKIKSKLDEEEFYPLKTTFSALYNHSATPLIGSFNSILNKINQTDSLNAFKPLKEYEVEAPFTFEKLMEIVKSLNLIGNSKKVAKVLSFNKYKKSIAIAAAIILAISGLLIYTDLNKKNNNQEFTAANTLPAIINSNKLSVDTVTTTTPVSADVAQHTIQNNLNSKYEFSNSPFLNTKNSRYKPSKQAKYGFSNFDYKQKNSAQVLIDGESYPVIDNDYLLTFVSFNNDKLPSFLNEESDKVKSITVDKYSYFEISEGMGSMMKKMYKTKSNGSPTRRARKQKATIEKWKAVDSAYFNQNSNLNPLDPRDLSNFILNK